MTPTKENAPAGTEAIGKTSGNNICSAQKLGNSVFYSRGRSKFDNKPAQRTSNNFDDFVESIWADKSAEKGSTFICAPMIEGLHNDQAKHPGSNTWRQKHLAGRRSWQPFDVDYLADAEALDELLLVLSPYRGMVYTTASSTHSSPRVRVILSASREMKYEESESIGQVIERKIVDALGDRIKFDQSVYRGEQPCYLPTKDSKRYDLRGKALDVDFLLAEVEIPKKVKERVTAPELPSKDDWMRELLSGEDVHGGALRIVGRLVAKNVPDDVIRTIFRSLADTIANNRDDRRVWELLDNGELDRMIAGAHSKGYAGEAPAEFKLVPVAEFVRAGFKDAWFIDEVIPRAGLGLIYGESGSGKSFLVIDMMVAIAQGFSWRGHEVEQGRVVYIAAEGASGIKKRFSALQVAEEVDLATLDVLILEQAPNLLRDDDISLAEVIEAAGGASLIVVDTLAQTTPGANENSSEDIGLALNRCKRLHEATGAMVILIHHSGKDAARGARGWSGIKGALDCEIEVSRFNDSTRLAKVTKQKDGDDGRIYPFLLRQVEIDKRKNGKPVTSCVVEHIDQSVRRKGPKGEWQIRVWNYVSERADSGDTTISVGDIVEHIKSVTVATGDKEDRRRESIRRAINKLAAEEFFAIRGDSIEVPLEVLTCETEV